MQNGEEMKLIVGEVKRTRSVCNWKNRNLKKQIKSFEEN